MPQVSAEREEEANEKPALDARTLAQRSAIREELSSITQKMVGPDGAIVGARDATMGSVSSGAVPTRERRPGRLL